MTPVDRRFIDRALSIVEGNLTAPEFCVSVFARKMALSRSQLHRRLTALTGASASAFIRNRRLKKAENLMKQGVHPLSVVARQVGFGSLAYFRKCFKESYGVVPSEYWKGMDEV